MYEGTPFGLPPTELDELIYDVYYDTVFFKPGDTLTNIRFFQNDSKDEQYRNFSLNSVLTVDTAILGYHVEHNFKFNVGSNTGFEKQFQAYFEQCSVLNWTKEKKQACTVPLTDILNYQPYVNGGTYTTRELRSGYYPLLNRVEIPTGGRFRIDLTVAKNLALASTGIGYFPLAGLTSDLGYAIRLKMYVAVRQPLS